FISNASRRNMRDWTAHAESLEYAMSSDWDNRWRTGGSIAELTGEAHINAEWLLKGIEHFVTEREQRRERLHGFSF
ncbi:hypothetical protein KAH55_11510, partial [bacterium]|nr:hypothetical protein [bacterium]